MGRLFPIRSSPDPAASEEPRIVGLEDADADEVFDALGPETARRILAACYDEPRPASELATAADTSLQNARYHLDKLQEAGVVEVVDTWYSERGTEMKVYAPANESLVVFGGEEQSRLRDALARLLSVVAVLGGASLLVQRLARRGPGAVPTADGGDGGTEGDAATTVEEQPVTDAERAPETTYQATETTAEAARTAAEAGGEALLPPGVVFALGGLFALALVVVVWRL